MVKLGANGAGDAFLRGNVRVVGFIDRYLRDWIADPSRHAR
jgi:hypothetical protein